MTWFWSWLIKSYISLDQDSLNQDLSISYLPGALPIPVRCNGLISVSVRIGERTGSVNKGLWGRKWEVVWWFRIGLAFPITPRISPICKPCGLTIIAAALWVGGVSYKGLYFLGPPWCYRKNEQKYWIRKFRAYR